MKKGVIAFCGSKGSGKNTSADVVKALYPNDTEELAFADHLKKTCSKVCKVDMKYFLDPKLKEVELETYVVLQDTTINEIFAEFEVTEYTYDKHVRPHVGQVFDTPRSLLQYVGTEVLHPIDPLIHAKITMKKKNPDKLSIITDLRFLQEFEFLKSQPGFFPIYVSNKRAEMLAEGDTHPSEKQLQLFKSKCEPLDNNGKLNELEPKVKVLLEKFEKGN